ncbi:single-stranded DNA-binding protein [Microbacterium amylolyticum]|uniref:Single-stranded DNA-binding protein n=1 Tax=Microbacterium amylolyticum TaxID=936337 RepID=A0ABS4ZN43_9MICO|nr:single-stranded DNA-binding protein [Microbacterium amylolyticum]MBP2437866.1 single-strand DNA-binding protein [Microbacterium amylolyticum]
MSSITFAGNLAEEVELRYAQNGRAMARFRVLENRRTRNADGEWVDAEPNAWRVQVWGDMAENVAASCHKGDRVHITGDVQTDVWPDKETGQTRRSQKIDASEVSFSLRFHQVKATKMRGTARKEAAPAEPAADPMPLHPQTSWPSRAETPAPPAHPWETVAIPSDDQPI